MLLPDILRPFGITTHKELATLLRCHAEHARKFWDGRRRLSIKAAEKIKAHTNGTYSIDFLLSIKPNS